MSNASRTTSFSGSTAELASVGHAQRPAPARLHQDASSSWSDKLKRIKEELRMLEEESELRRSESANAVIEDRVREPLGNSDSAHGSQQDYLDRSKDSYQEIESLHGAYGRILKSREELEDKRKAKLRDMKAKLRQADELLVARDAQLRDIKVKLKQAEDLLITKDTELRNMKTRLGQAEGRSAARNADLQHNKTSLRQMKEHSAARIAELRRIKIGLRQTEELSAARNAELSALRAFFPKVDYMSSVQLKQTVDDLNNEIFQLTSTIVGSMENKYRTVPISPQAVQKSQSNLINKGILSREFVQSFLDDTFLSPADTSMAFEIGLRACMGYLCQWVALSISRDAGKQVNQILDAIRKAESYPVFARWRAMTHKQKAGPENQRQWEDLMEATLIDVLNICGYQHASQECIDQNKTRIQRLVDMALKLNHAIMQETFWIDVDVFWITAQSLFFPSAMIDDSERSSFKNRVLSDTPILATTALGLALRRVKVDSQDRDEQFDKWEIAVRAAVALPDSIQHKGSPAVVAYTDA